MQEMQGPNAGGRRPQKRTDARRAAYLEVLRVGTSREAAARPAGCGPSTAWRRTGDDPAFALDVEVACAEAEVRMTAAVSDAAANDWRAAAWWLERRRPDVFGRHNRVDVSVDVGILAKRLALELNVDEKDIIVEAERLLA